MHEQKTRTENKRNGANQKAHPCVRPDISNRHHQRKVQQGKRQSAKKANLIHVKKSVSPHLPRVQNTFPISHDNSQKQQPKNHGHQFRKEQMRLLKINRNFCQITHGDPSFQQRPPKRMSPPHQMMRRARWTEKSYFPVISAMTFAYVSRFAVRCAFASSEGKKFGMKKESFWRI